MNITSLNKLVSSLNSLPGIGKKQAEKIAYYIIRDNYKISSELEETLIEVRNKIISCSICSNITEDDVCYICKDKDRERKLVIVETPLEVFKFEETKTIKPYYHVLNGLINIQKNINIQDLNIEKLKDRSSQFKEVILALSPNLEGIVTANYIKSLIGDKVKVTQLAQGIPLGAAIEYVDEITLKSALNNRKEVK